MKKIAKKLCDNETNMITAEAFSDLSPEDMKGYVLSGAVALKKGVPEFSLPPGPYGKPRKLIV
jgi:hypothetical protein